MLSRFAFASDRSARGTPLRRACAWLRSPRHDTPQLERTPPGPRARRRSTQRPCGHWELHATRRSKRRAWGPAFRTRPPTLALSLPEPRAANHTVTGTRPTGLRAPGPGTSPPPTERRERHRERPDDPFVLRQVDYVASVVDGDFKGIDELWTVCLARHPDDGRALLERAGTRHRLGRTDDSRADLRRSCELGLSEACALLRR